MELIFKKFKPIFNKMYLNKFLNTKSEINVLLAETLLPSIEFLKYLK